MSSNLSRFYQKKEKKNREHLSRLVSGSSSTRLSPAISSSPAAGPAKDAVTRQSSASPSVNEPTTSTTLTSSFVDEPRTLTSSSSSPLGKRKRDTEGDEQRKKNKGKEVVRDVEVIEISSDGNVRKILKFFKIELSN